MKLSAAAESQLDSLARMLTADLGEGAAIVLFDDEGPARSFAAHRQPGKSELVGRLAMMLAGDREFFKGVLDAGGPVLMDDLPPRLTLDSPLGQLASTVGLRSALCVPVPSLVPGMVAVLSSAPPRYDPPCFTLINQLGQLAGRILDPDFAPDLDADDLLAAVRHDLGNPLQAIALNLELVLERLPADDRRSSRCQLERAQRAVKNAQQMLAELDLHADGSSNGSPASSAGAAITEVLEVLSAAAREKRVSLRANLDDGAATAAISSRHLFRVLSNLVGNAVKYCAPGDDVTIQCWRRRDRVVFGVFDTGPGIAADDLARLFDAEWLASSPIRRGSGLGLAICKRIVHRYDGRLSAFSRAGRGSAFTVELPLAVAPSLRAT